tara:strand:+ start:790 stop:1020 length:231 start_codon:yes stop_codon:yes gene_type:complete
MNLIERDDPRYFTQTSDKPYDRHLYKVVYHCSDFGCEHKIVDSWEEARELWWNSIPQFISHIEVLDKPKKKSKGFK